MPKKSAGSKKVVKRNNTTRTKPRKPPLSTTKLEDNDTKGVKRKRQTTPIQSQQHHACEACKNTREAMSTFFEGRALPFHDLELGSLGGLSKSTRCFLHQSILRLCTRWLDENDIVKNSNDLVKLEQSYNSLGIPHSSKLCIDIGHYREHRPAGPELNIVAFEAPSVNRPYGRLIDTREIDLGIVRKWIGCCDSWHAGHCHSLPEQRKLPWPSHIRLIDVQRGCLVQGSLGDTYVALSYVWGSVNNRAHQFHTTESNLERYEQEGMLSVDSPENQIPQTVKDAMRLVRMLDQRFLWVDCFCIVQDNADAVDFQIKQMGSIFANAYFTIIASDGDNADCGIRGIGSGSRPRGITQEVFDYAPRRHALGLISNMVEYSTWNKRGWTFQEKLFSQRKLIFSNGIVRWMCHCLEWSEDVVAETEPIAGPSYCENISAVGAFAFNHSIGTMFLEYATLAEDYCETNFTREGDVLNAFSGIISALSRTFVGGFHYGLPDMFFDLALLWQFTAPCTRRHSGGDHEHDAFPSWSWAGWKGARGYIYLGYAPGSAREEDDEDSWELRSTVKWYKLDSQDDDKIEICNSWQDYRHSCADVSQPLPLGWSRHRSKRKSRKTSPNYYTHDSDPDTTFRFPIPIQSTTISETPENSNSSPALEWSPILSFSTNRTTLSTGPACHAHPIPPTQCLPVSLLAPQNQWAGLLYLNIPASHPAPLSFRVDLIELSAGSAKNKSDESFYFPEWDVEDRPKTREMYDFYNVMWVEWRDGIAYRRSVGRVAGEVWERLELERCDVRLG